MGEVIEMNRPPAPAKPRRRDGVAELSADATREQLIEHLLILADDLDAAEDMVSKLRELADKRHALAKQIENVLGETERQRDRVVAGIRLIGATLALGNVEGARKGIADLAGVKFSKLERPLVSD